MKIIISPAKTMNVDTDSLSWRDLPAFLPQTETILGELKAMDYDALKALWKCSDKIAMENVERLADMDLQKRLTTDILAYEGIQYKYMAPSVFTNDQFSYIQEHLRILSGFYGILRPLDGVVPYRLEMQSKLEINGVNDLYAFWGSSLAEALVTETDCIVNLASKEYSVCISKYIPDSVRYISCVFGELRNGKVIEKGTACKMARGEMVRYMAENEIKRPEDIRGFDCLNYRFSEKYSDDSNYVFVVNSEETAE